MKPRKHNGGRIVFSIDGVRNTGYPHVERMILDPYHITIHKKSAQYTLKT